MEKRLRLMAAVDEVNGRFGQFSADVTAQGFKRECKMRADNKSPTWTTRLDGVPVASAQ